MARGLAEALKDFGSGAMPAARLASVDDDTRGVAAPAPRRPPAESFDARQLREAVEQAQTVLADRLAADHAAQIADMEARHQAELERVRRDFGAETGRVVAERLAECEREIRELATGATGRILGIALTETVTRRAVDELGDALRSALEDRETVRIRVRGPLSAWEQLKPALGRFGDHAEFTEAATFDLTVTVDDMLFETRLADWSKALEELVA